MERKEPKKRDTSFPIALAVLVFLGGLIRLVNLGNIIFYWDEPLHCVRIAAQSLRWTLAHNDGSAFFALLVHLLLPLGKLEWMARLPSFLAGILVIPAVYYLGKELLGRRAGLLAAAFTTFSPLLIQYSQYSRMYATYSFFSLLTVYFYYRALRENTRGLWTAYAASLTLNIYNHIFGLFVVPVFALFSGLLSLREQIRRPGRLTPAKTSIPGKFLKFTAWTLLALLISALLSIPDKSLQSYLSASINRATSIASHGAATFGMIGTILKEQLKPTSSGFFWAFLALTAFGLLVSFKSRFKEASFALLYMSIPYIAFTLIKPNEPAALSATRYFLFILPFLYLFMGKGIVSIVDFLLSFITWSKAAPKHKHHLRNALTILCILFFVGKGFDLKSYYVEYWRLGAPPLDSETRKCLENNLKRDAFVFIDEPPFTSMVVAINPLTKNMKPKEIEYIIRENLQVEKDKNPVMFLTMHPNLLKYYAPDKVDLWVITKKRGQEPNSFFQAARSISDMRFFPLKKHWLICLQDEKIPLYRKWIQAVDILLPSEREQEKIKDAYYLASRSYLYAKDFDGFLSEYKKARSIPLSPGEAVPRTQSFLIRNMDRLMGLDVEELKNLNEKRFHKELSHLLLIQGDILKNKGNYHQALLAYKMCAEFDPVCKEQVSIRLGFQGNSLFRKAKFQEAVSAYKEAVWLRPERYDLRFMLAESLRKTGDTKQARAEYTKVFGLGLLPEKTWETLLFKDPLVLIWKKGKLWFIIFRTQKGTVLHGRIRSSQKIKDIKTRLFIKKDRLHYSGPLLQLDLSANKGVIKAFSFRSSKKAEMQFDFRINEKKKKANVFFLNLEHNLK